MNIVSFENFELDVIVATLTDDEEKIWFRARDVAFALGYTRPSEAVRDHVRDKYKTTWVFEEVLHPFGRLGLTRSHAH